LPQKKQEAGQGWPIENVERRATDELVPYARNARTHSDQQVDQIAASIAEWGWTMPVLIDEGGVILAGHGRVLAARRLGIEEVPVIVAKGWSEPQRRAYVLADNKLTLNGGWDEDLLRVEIADLELEGFDLELTGFDPDEIAQALRDGTPVEDDTEPVPEPPADPVSREGDLWLLDQHRVLCGDSTSAKSWERLLDGAVPQLMVTDPPYGVEYDPQWRADAGIKISSLGKVANDDRPDWTEVWKCFPGDVAYIWHASLFMGVVGDSLIAAGLELRSQLIWAKSRFAISRGHYHWQHEAALYAVRKGRTAKWIGDRKQSTVWEIPTTDDGDKTPHSTQKPLECMARPMRNHDAPEIVDPFLGSGSTLIAAEVLGRKGYGIELNPAYVDVVVERWSKRTGKTPRLEDGRSFEEVRLERSPTNVGV
jgi:DNA modification methylase